MSKQKCAHMIYGWPFSQWSVRIWIYIYAATIICQLQAEISRTFALEIFYVQGI
jgi:hypothetical protein